MNIIDYKIKCPDYSSILNVNDFYRTEDDKGLNLLKFNLNQKAADNFSQGEVFFANGNMDSAVVYYQKAYAEDSSAFNALTYIGQCYSLTKKYDEAEAVLKKVIEKNYIDYMAHWFLSDVYAVRNKWKDAAREITISSVLNRNNPRIHTRLVEVYKKANINWNEFTFNPQIKLIDLGGTDSVKILSDRKWLMYANTKAVWAFEYQYRESMGGEKAEFSIQEELESLAVLYTGLKNADEDFDDVPELVALEKAIKNKMLYQYIFYEVMFLKHPIIAYTLPREELDKIADYVMKVRTWKD
ncbi:MAG: tetratricopeptide repeat protein [Ignavibacteria bacterium]|nr:tetratricopeptide repeat protein [Ignavibacteria bacterium]